MARKSRLWLWINIGQIPHTRSSQAKHENGETLNSIHDVIFFRSRRDERALCVNLKDSQAKKLLKVTQTSSLAMASALR